MIASLHANGAEVAGQATLWLALIKKHGQGKVFITLCSLYAEGKGHQRIPADAVRAQLEPAATRPVPQIDPDTETEKKRHARIENKPNAKRVADLREYLLANGPTKSSTIRKHFNWSTFLFASVTTRAGKSLIRTGHTSQTMLRWDDSSSAESLEELARIAMELRKKGQTTAGTQYAWRIVETILKETA
jgi:hypothetical protein